jgi:hypothetical protein
MNSSYNLSYSTGSLTINKRNLVITASSPSVTYGDSVPTITPGYSGFADGDGATSAVGFVSGSCSTSYSSTTNVSSSPVATSCSGFSASNYTISYANGSITIARKVLSITGTSVSSRAFNATTNPGVITVGTLSGLVGQDTLRVAATGSAYSAAAPETYTTTVTYVLSDALNGVGKADNYTLAPQTLQGQILPAAVGFTLTTSFGISTQFQIKYGNTTNPITLTATTSASGTVAFQYESTTASGTVWQTITSCEAVAVTLIGSSGAANCDFNAPTNTNQSISFKATHSPSSQSQTIQTRIVARPVIDSFSAASGAVGSQITINGSNFLGITSISFNGTAANMSLVRATSTRILVTVPSGATTGPVVVTTQFGGSGTSPSNFTVN